jgi:serine/threonine protein kinase
VLRAYDNRLVYTNRRPEVYLKFFKDTMEVVVEYEDRALATVNHDEPAPETLPFGTFQMGSNDRDWLWSFCGGLSVLSVPYHPGRHWTREISEFIPVLKELRALHRGGFVHGDIRCCNTVFAGANGHLIDFDLGGNVAGHNRPKFPANYVFVLPDGNRLPRPNAAISTMDDVYAMTQVVLSFHKLRPPLSKFDVGKRKPSEDLTEGTSLPPKKLKLEDELAKREELFAKREELFAKREELFAKREELAAERDELQSFAPQVDDDHPRAAEQAAENLLTALIELLTKAMGANWTICPQDILLLNMKRWGFDVSNEEGGWNHSRQEAEHATGSPEKKVKKL